MSSGKKPTVGYWYYLGLHLGICHGPVDAVLKIKAGDREAWSGTVTGNSTISINALNLWGGEKREGGLMGDLDVMMGGSGQASNGYLTSVQSGMQPAYKGILGLVYRKGVIGANNPYVKPWAIKVRRITAGWRTSVWYSAKASITLESGDIAANPAHIVYECLTNFEWGLGWPTTNIDVTSFTAAADQFYAEGLGLCVQWSRQESIEQFIQLIVNHAGAVLGQDRESGYFVLHAIRDNYDIEDLEEYSDATGNVLSLDSFERASYTEAINELTVKYTDVVTGKEGSITVQQLANIQSQQAVIAQTREYPGIPNSALALRIAMRDLNAAASGLARVRMVLNREAYRLLPGDVINFAWAPLGITQMALRILEVDYGTLTDGRIRVQAVEDVFGLPDTTYAVSQPQGWTLPDTTPQASAAVLAFEAPYRDLIQTLGAAETDQLASDAGFLGFVAEAPPGVSINYQLRTRVGANAYAEATDADWTPKGIIAGALTHTTTALVLSSVSGIERFLAGDAAMIISGTFNEIVRIEAVNSGTSTVTVARGCADTVPRTFPAGAQLWAYDDWASGDGIEYSSGEVVSGKALTQTTTGRLAEGSATAATVTMNSRAARPYPPGKLRINNLAYPASITGTITASWVHRDKKLIDDQLVSEGETGTTAPAGVTYRARLFNHTSGTMLQEISNITGTSQAFTSPGSPGDYRVEVASTNGTLFSWSVANAVFSWTA